MNHAGTQRSILVANAGSGKTWTLANRVLSWCFSELRAGRAPRPAAILAVTFTRKAAGEILARILTHAAQGAEDTPAGARSRGQFAPVVGAAGSDEYLAVLEALCRDLHRMQIGTIDGYFHRIATAMPEEVGLPPDWTVGEQREIELLRSEAAARVLADPSAPRFVALLEDGAPKASVLSSITALAGGRSVSVLDHYRACAIEGEAGIDRAWRWLARIPQASDVAGADAEVHYRRACDLWRALEVPLTADRRAPKPRARWASAHRAVLDCLERRDFRKLAEQGILARLDAQEPFDRCTPPEKWLEAFAAIRPHLRAGLIAQARGRMEGALEVIPVADRALAELQAERGIYSFGDIGLGVARAARRSGSRVADPAALRAAIGAEIADLAIDEAQDTSAEQFAALRPLIEDILGIARDATDAVGCDPQASPGRFLVVGDPKQSIYGWRGGTPGLVAEMERRYGSALDADEPLRRSFRSSRLLMDFVNRVFSHLAEEVPALVDDPEHRQPLLAVGDFIAREELPPEVADSAFIRALAEWRFEPHEAANASLPGRIAAYAYGKPRAEDADGDIDPGGSVAGSAAETREGAASPAVSAAERAASVAACIHRSTPERTVGILVRTNRVANDVIEALRAAGVPASDEGRATLLDSPAVVGVIQILRLVDEPGDRIAHFLVSRGPIGAWTGLRPLEEAATLDAARADAARFAAGMRRRIADEGLARVLRDLVGRLAEAGLPARDRGRLERVVAIAEDLADAPPARLSEFIEAIAEDQADASSADRIRVMTVHASKGLEFDEVVLASLDDAWGETPTDWASVATDPTGAPQLVGPLGNSAMRHWVPELSILERDERRRGLLDDLSLFYVAVTRARRGLHLVVSNNPGGRLPTAAKLIARALERVPAAPDAISDAISDATSNAPGETPSFAGALADARHDREDPFWSVEFAGAAEAPRSEGAPDPGHRAADVAGIVHAPAAALVEIVDRSGARAKPPSAHEAAGLWADDPFGNDDIPLRGVLVHECFREVRSIEDLVELATPDPSRLAALVARAAERATVEKGAPVPRDMSEDAVALLTRIVGRAGTPGSIAEALRASASDEVRNEHPFLREVSGEGGQAFITAGRIDRLVLHRDEQGRAVGATVLDYKTGATGASAELLEAKLVGYRAQMRAYCAAVEELWSLPKGAAHAKLLFVDRDDVVDVVDVVELERSPA